MIVRYDVGAPLVGHALLLIQVGDKWHFIEFIGGFKKSSASVTLRDYNPKNLDKALRDTSKYQRIYIKGDFTESYNLAKQYYDNASYPGYNLFNNNCLHYALTLLRVGTFNRQYVQSFITSQYNYESHIIPATYIQKLQETIYNEVLPLINQRIINVMRYHTDGSLFLVR